MKEEKKSILNEALADFNEIMQAADINAKKRLAEEFSDKFNTFLNEELKKKNNKKESYKKIDENKESEESKLDEKIQSNNQNQMKEETKKEETPVVENSEVKTTEEKNKDLQTENFDMRGLDTNSVGTALENMDTEDEVITMEEIENEINNLDTLSPEENPESESHEETEMELLMKIKSDLDLIIGKLGDTETEPEMPTDNAETDSLTDDDIDSVLNMQDEEPEVDEAKGLSYASRRNTSGRNLPNNNYLSSMESDQSPYLQEAKAKINGLIKENKELTKKVNLLKSNNKTSTDLLENYKNALAKYRSQLTEMAIFNTNLVNVNNLLVNEELNLTQDDKVKIIGEFKSINSISESQDKYGKLLSEMKETKSTISENFENKVSASIQPSSKQQLSEAIEKTAYSSNDLNRIKSLIDYAEKRGKK